MQLLLLTKYKDIIVLRAKERRLHFGQRFSLAKVAAACGIQKTYLSKVFNSSAHLNPDQLSAACEFLNFTEDESEYTLLLREQEIATHPARQRRITAKIEGLRAAMRKTTVWLKDAGALASPELAWIYYTDLYLQLTHLFLTIPRYQADPRPIAQALGLSTERVNDLLFKLERHGLATFDGKCHKAVDFNIHLDAASPIFRPHRSLQRLRCLEKMDKIDDEAAVYSLAVAFAASPDTYAAIRTRILELIRQAQSAVVESSAEHVYQLNLDFFRWDDAGS